MPWWFDLLRTPMAAPETARLRRMRHRWQLGCILLAGAVAGFPWWRSQAGRVAPLLVAWLTAQVAIYTLLYLRRKQRADNFWLEQVREAGQ